MRRLIHTQLAILATLLAMPASIFDDITKWFSGGIKDVVELAERAYGAIRTVWHVAGRIFELVGEGWDWMVNGIEWLGNNVVNFAGSVYNAIYHVLTSVIPKAIGWALKEAIKWTEKEVGKLTTWVEKRAAAIEKWAVGEFNKLLHTIITDAKNLWNDITKVFNWIDTAGHKVLYYIEHPGALAELLAAHIVWPVIVFIIKGSADIFSLLIRQAATREKEFAHTLEDVLARFI